MMPALRLLGLIIIGGLVTIGVIADQRERTSEELPSPVVIFEIPCVDRSLTNNLTTYFTKALF